MKGLLNPLEGGKGPTQGGCGGKVTTPGCSDRGPPVECGTRWTQGRWIHWAAQPGVCWTELLAGPLSGLSMFFHMGEHSERQIEKVSLILLENIFHNKNSACLVLKILKNSEKHKAENYHLYFTTQIWLQVELWGNRHRHVMQMHNKIYIEQNLDHVDCV